MVREAPHAIAPEYVKAGPNAIRMNSEVIVSMATESTCAAIEVVKLLFTCILCVGAANLRHDGSFVCEALWSS